MKNTIVFIVVISGLLLSGCSLFQPQRPTDSNVLPDKENIQVDDNKATEDPQTNKKLDLSDQNLEIIPEYVFSQEDLEELDVSNNRLTGAIQAEIRQLQNLTVLNAGNNQMTGVPAEIGQLKNLQVLDLSDNLLTGLPLELGNLQNLTTLDISGNNYSELDLSTIQEKLPKDVNIIK
jgi:Leucine-rich repeat (LRR) protein